MPFLFNDPFCAFLTQQGTAVAHLMRDPSLISDDRLRREVEDCMSEDKDYSPYLDRVRRGLGAEYEFILQQKLRARYSTRSETPPLSQRLLTRTYRW